MPAMCWKSRIALSSCSRRGYQRGDSVNNAVLLYQSRESGALPFTLKCFLVEAPDELETCGIGYLEDVFPGFVSLQHLLTSMLPAFCDITAFEHLPHTKNILVMPVVCQKRRQHNGWRICGEHSRAFRKLTVSDQLSQSCESAICAFM